MGYSTKFSGKFTFDKPLPEDVVAKCHAIYNDEHGEECPSKYCQWVLTSDKTGLKWDGGEKFYHYRDWLKWLCKNVFAPAGVTVVGSVRYQGDDLDDAGVLVMVNGEVFVRELQVVEDSYEELRRFRDMVLNSHYRQEILELWVDANL